MATLLAPYNTAMQLGTGFNSFTQQICIDKAVIRETDEEPHCQLEHKDREVPQSVTYKTSVIDKVTDVTNAMNINAAFSIKYDTFDAKGKGDFINTSKIKESDISFLISVKVVNQVIYDHSLTKFNSISGLKTTNFTDVYGDCYIAGFQEGGEFTAVISVKGKDKEQSEMIKADAAINFTKDKMDLQAEGEFGKNNTDFLTENETTISVSWSGGGQNLKPTDQDWTFETMKAAALKFPDLVARTPLRTHAILTKYTALRSFHATNSQITLPQFEKAGVYANILQEAYLDYKTIAKNLQVLAFDVSSGVQTLQQSLIAAGSEADKAQESEENSVFSMRTFSIDDLKAGKRYPANIEGLELAKTHCRYMLNRIVTEVDEVARNPDIATDETRALPYMSPFLFKEIIPIGVPVVTSEEDEAEATEKSDVDKVGGALRRF